VRGNHESCARWARLVGENSVITRSSRATFLVKKAALTVRKCETYTVSILIVMVGITGTIQNPTHHGITASLSPSFSPMVATSFRKFFCFLNVLTVLTYWSRDQAAF
jgi:hypothetical protein